MGRLYFLILALFIVIAGCGPQATQTTPPASKQPPKVSIRAQTGAGPNHAILIENANPPLLAVAASMDSAVQFFELPSMTLKGSVSFKLNADLISPNPWALAANSDGSFVAVSLFDDHKVGLVDVNARRLISTSGVPDTHGTARHPTAVMFVGNDLYVAFSNLKRFADFSEPSQYEPGLVARFSLDTSKLVFKDSTAIPCKNPSDMSVDDNARLVVACAGSQYFDNNKNLQLQGGAAIVILETRTPLSVVESVPLTAFSPGKVISYEDGYFLANNLKRQILFVAKGASSDASSVLIPLNTDAPQETGYISTMVKGSHDVAWVADFRTDQIFALDLKSRSLAPEPISLQGKGAPIINKGPIAMAMSSSGEIYVLMALSAEILSVTLGGT